MNAQTSAGKAALLQIHDLAVALPKGGDRPFAVRNVTFDLHENEILCVVGESGSGKSITANGIMGLLPEGLMLQKGEIRYRGQNLLAQREEELRLLRGREIAMIFQEPMSALNPVMTVGEQVAEVMEVHGTHSTQECRERVIELLDYVGLPEPADLQHTYPFRLSGGQRQRVMIAMALALEPSILIADEPTTALDVTTQAQILALIKNIQSVKQMGVMFITHDFGVVADIADRVVVMEKGVIVEQGPVSEVLYHPQHPYTQQLINAVPSGRIGAARSERDEAPLLEVRGLQKTYSISGGLLSRKRVVKAVDNVSFTVFRGETLGVVGESGSGKTTMGRCLTKLVGIEGGQLLFNGLDIAPMTQAEFRPYRKNIQMIFQDPFASLNPKHTVGRIITDGLRANGIDDGEADRRTRELLDLVELSSSAFKRYPHEFSGGQRQRIGIARALALEPELLIADEPVSALDVSVQAQVLSLLKTLQQRLNIAIVFITHDLRVAAELCHRIAVMRRGEVVECGPVSQVLEAPVHEYTQRLVGATPGKAWLQDRQEIG